MLPSYYCHCRLTNTPNLTSDDTKDRCPVGVRTNFRKKSDLCVFGDKQSRCSKPYLTKGTVKHLSARTVGFRGKQRRKKLLSPIKFNFPPPAGRPPSPGRQFFFPASRRRACARRGVIAWAHLTLRAHPTRSGHIIMLMPIKASIRRPQRDGRLPRRIEGLPLFRNVLTRTGSRGRRGALTEHTRGPFTAQANACVCLGASRSYRKRGHRYTGAP